MMSLKHGLNQNFGQSIHQLFELGDQYFMQPQLLNLVYLNLWIMVKLAKKFMQLISVTRTLVFGMKQVNSSRVHLIAGYKDTITNKFVKFVVFALIDSKIGVKLKILLQV